MRVATSELQQQAIRAILQQQAAVGRTQLQLSTGRRILAPSDDPSASTRVLDLAKVVETTEQYQRNADAAQARLEIEDGTLRGMVDALQRARELMVRAANDTESAESREAAAVEVREILATIQSLANTKDGNGEYLFSGFSGRVEAIADDGAGTYTYNGDQGQRTLQIGPTRQVAVGDTGFELFMNVPGASDNVFEILHGMAVDLEANAPDASVLGDIDAAMDNLLNAQGRIGARLNAVDSQRDVNAASILQYEETRSSLEGLDYAEAVSRLNSQMIGLQAAQQSYVRVQGLSLFNYL